MATAYRSSALSADELDISQPDLWTDRYAELLPRFKALRDQGPVVWCPGSESGPYWSVLAHREIVEVESKPELFSSSWERGGITIGGKPPPADREELRFPMFIAMDRPEHTGQRRSVAGAFMPSEMDRLRADIRQRTAAMLDSLPVGEPFDWVDTVSVELTTQMLAILFDFPWEDRRLLPFWSDTAVDFDAIHDKEAFDNRHRILFEMVAYFQRLWEERKAKGQAPDLISRMIHSEATRNMSQLEYLGNLILLIVGGNDTTRNSMTGAAIVQNRYPEEWAKLVADPSLIPNATSELIRWQTPLAHMRRTATADTALAGQTIREGDMVLMWYLSANRDDSFFPDADRWRPDRENARRHLAFGHGIHRCVGARLAELQLGILFEEMLARKMTVRQLEEPTRVHNCFVHGYRKLTVEVGRG